EYLQINLLVLKYITKVATQGKNEVGGSQWVTRYRLDYSQDGTNWLVYKVYTYNIFTYTLKSGNIDRNSVVTHVIQDPFKAVMVRFVVQEWSVHICMRVEVYGCSTQ
ncbi:predicted protein, partial [Nematostella vectensis]